MPNSNFNPLSLLGRTITYRYLPFLNSDIQIPENLFVRTSFVDGFNLYFSYTGNLEFMLSLDDSLTSFSDIDLISVN